jgi:hypothetical protein
LVKWLSFIKIKNLIMKRLITIIVTFITCGLAIANATTNTDKRNLIKWNGAELGKPTYSLTLCYERVLNPLISLQGDVSLAGASQTINLGPDGSGTSFNGQISASEVGFSPELRFYIQKHAPIGFYIGPYVTYRHYKLQIKGTSSNGQAARIDDKAGLGGIGLLVGYQFLFGNIFSLDITTGFGAYGLKIEKPVATLPDHTQITLPVDYKNSFGTPIFGLSLGFAF